MTSTEIAVSIIAGLFALYALAMTLVAISALRDQHKRGERLVAAKADAESEKLWAGRWRDEAQKQDKRCHELDLGVGRAIVRIIRAHGEACYPSIDRGLLRALNILEEETGRYKEEKEEPSPAYLQALGKREYNRRQQIAVRQSQEADRQLRRDMADYERTGRQPTSYPCGPPPEKCKVCGRAGYTYRWGQVLTTRFSGSGEETTKATVEWQKYNHNYDVGWFPVCAHHASVLDKHGTVTHTTHRSTPPRYPHRTGGTPPMPGSPPVPGTVCAVCHMSKAITHVYGFRTRGSNGLPIFQGAHLSGSNNEQLPVCANAKQAFERQGYVTLPS